MVFDVSTHERADIAGCDVDVLKKWLHLAESFCTLMSHLTRPKRVPSRTVSRMPLIVLGRRRRDRPSSPVLSSAAANRTPHLDDRNEAANVRSGGARLREEFGHGPTVDGVHLLSRARATVEELVRRSRFTTQAVDAVLAYSFFRGVELVAYDPSGSVARPRQPFRRHATVPVHAFRPKAVAARVPPGQYLLCPSPEVDAVRVVADHGPARPGDVLAYSPRRSLVTSAS